MPALWRRAFNAVERPMAVRLEQAVQTERFADVVGIVVTARRGVDRKVEQLSRRALHRLNLPAASDMTRLSDQIVALDRRMRDLRAQLEAEEGEVDGGSPGARGAAREGAPRRRPQRAARPERTEVRRGSGPAAGRKDA